MENQEFRESCFRLGICLKRRAAVRGVYGSLILSCVFRIENAIVSTVVQIANRKCYFSKQTIENLKKNKDFEKVVFAMEFA